VRLRDRLLVLKVGKMSISDWTERLSPPELVRATTRLTELGFAREFGASPFVAIRVRNQQDGLSIGLETTLAGVETAPARPLGQLGFHTEMASVNSYALELKARAATVTVPDVRHLTRVLADGPHFVASLRKRSGADSAFANRISVGRAPNKDLVLRHGSISKFHAYFQVDEQDCYYVADAGSKNGTLLNGSRLLAREPTPVQNGDFVVFGSVEAMVLDARTLWRALRAA
jgi:hypothetical protein